MTAGGIYFEVSEWEACTCTERVGYRSKICSGIEKNGVLCSKYIKGGVNMQYEVCSKSVRIGIVVVIHWVGCVCNQS